MTTGTGAEADHRTWHGHVIVCGLGGVAIRTVEQLLLAGVRVIVLDDDPNPRSARMLGGWGVDLIPASSHLPENLEGAGLAGATAVICVEEDDLSCLETAMLVHELRPEVRVVVQLTNAAVGRAVTEITGPGSVLDVASLAAPTMVESCLPGSSPEIDIGGVMFAMVEHVVGEAATLRHLYGDLAPIAVVHRGSSEVVVAPGRDYRVAVGDTVTLLGSEQQFDTSDVPWRTSETEHLPPVERGFLSKLKQIAVTLFTEADRPLRIAVVAVVAFALISASILTLGYRGSDGIRMSPLDSLYFSVETMTTIGYGDFSFRGQEPWLRVFATFLMVGSAILVAVFFALLTNYLVSRRIAESLGRRALTGITGHVVVIGLGSVGLKVVEGILARHRPVVVIERDAGNRFMEQARAMGVPVLVGDATVGQTLHAANLAAASAVAVMTSDDLVNIETGLAVRDHLGDRWVGIPVVMRLFDRELGNRIERNFGFRYVRSTSALAAPWFVGEALGLDVLRTFYVEDQPLLLGHFIVASGGGLDGLAMLDLSAHIWVTALRRASGGHLQYPPRRDTRFAAGDQAYMVGPYEELLDVLRQNSFPGTTVPHGSALAPAAFDAHEPGS